MTNSFPDFPKDPDTTPEWYNAATEEWYDWNADTQAWRRRSAAEGGGGPLIPDIDVDAHQDGTLDDRYVEVSGDTMKGDLIQFPSEDIYPGNEGELATAVPDGKEIEFRYMNGAGDTVCASLPLSPCGKIVDPVIAIDGSAETFAGYNEDLILVSDGVVPNATLSDQVWEFSDDGLSWSNSPATAPPAPYTVTIADQGKMYRVAQTFEDDTDASNTTVYSNAISVTNEPPPITEWIGWTHTGGSAKITISRTMGSDSAVLYKNDGTWTKVEDIVLASSALDSGTYILEASAVASINFQRSTKSITLNFDQRSVMSYLTSMENAFTGLTKFNQDLTGFDWSNVTNWSDAFRGCSLFNSPVTGIIHSGVTEVSRMFKDTNNFDQPLTNWDTSGVKLMNGMFENSVFNQSVSNLDTSSVENFAAMFFGTKEFNQSVNNFDISSASEMSAMFRAAVKFNQPISSWVFSPGCVVAGLFAKTEAFNSALTFNTSNLTSLFEWFEGAKVFNDSSVDGLDVSNVESLAKTFKDTLMFNQDLTSWNTGKVTNMNLTFNGAIKFNGDISNWNVSSVTNFEDFLGYAEEYNKPLNSWNTSSATNMKAMFYRARKINQPLSNWSTGLVSNMDRMFGGAYEFNQDISSWCVPLISSSPTGFSDSSNAGFRDVPNAKHPKWGSCPPRILTNPVIK